MVKRPLHQKIIVFGAGAIGSLLAAKLSDRYGVVAIGRKEHIDVIQKQGLRITGLINQIFKLDATTQVPHIGEDAIIVLTTKAQSSATAVQAFKKQLTKNTVIVCVQNGLGSEEVVRNLTNCRVVRATTYLAAEMIAPGEIKFIGDLPTYFGKDSQDIANIFNTVGLKTEVVDQLKEEVWKKLVFNCVINGLGTILDVPNNRLHNPLLDDIKKALVTECQLVAIKEGVQLERDILEEINNFIQLSTNVNSTLQDLRKEKRTEIEYLNGAIVRLGEKHGIPTPVNKMICDLICFLETNQHIEGRA